MEGARRAGGDGAWEVMTAYETGRRVGIWQCIDVLRQYGETHASRALTGRLIESIEAELLSKADAPKVRPRSAGSDRDR